MDGPLISGKMSAPVARMWKMMPVGKLRRQGSHLGDIRLWGAEEKPAKASEEGAGRLDNSKEESFKGEGGEPG